MTTLRIDRLALRVADVGPEDAQRLARRLSEELALAVAPRRAKMDALQVRVDAPGGASIDRLAHQVATEVLRQIARQG